MENKKLRIAFLSRFQGRVERGAETYVLELSKRLSRKFEVEILSGENADSFSKIISGNYDFVIPVNGRIQGLKASLGRIFGHYKTIISGQAGICKDDIWNIFITAPDIYVALTDWEKAWAKKWAIKTKIAKISNGVNLENFSPNGEKIKINLAKPVVLSVGALFWYKHHVRTIKALEKLGRGSLLIIGSGPEKENLEKLGNKLLGSLRFKILQVPFKEISRYYRSCELFVLPSWDREAFGIVYLEAMASGLPVVAPDDSPRREIIGDAGIFVDVTNPKKYAEAITEALSKDWKDKSRKQAKKFSWDLIAEKYKDLFVMLCK